MKDTFAYPTLAPPVARATSGVGTDAFGDPRCDLDFIVYQGGERWASDWIRIQSFTGQDSISDFFQYQVELRANDQYVPARATTPRVEVRPFDFDEILGSDAMVRIGLPVERDSEGRPIEPVIYTPFCGIVTDLGCAGPGVYNVTLRPRMWKMTLRNGYRIFRGLTVKGVVDTLLTEHGIKDYDLSALDGVADGRQQDWLQAGETDFELLQRLLNKVGGYFYFEHLLPSGPRAPGIHKAVFGREPAYKEILGRDGRTLSLHYTFGRNESGLDSEDLLTELVYQRTMMPAGVSTTIAEVGSSWLQEPLAQVTRSSVPAHGDPPICVRYSVFEYGTCQAETDALSSSREQARLGSTFTLSGRSSATTLKSGHWFTLRQEVPPAPEGQRPDISNHRPDLDGKSFVLMSVSHQATVEGGYSSGFSARDRAASVLNFSMAATHQGSVLAQVVAHGGEGSAPHPRHHLATGNFALGGNTFENKLVGAAAGNRGGKLPCKGVYVQLVVGGDGPVFVKVPGSSSSIPEVGTWVVVGRSYNDSELPEIQQIAQSKGSQTIIPDEDNPRWATENTSVGNNYGTSYGDSHSIRYGRLSPVDLDSAAQDLKTAYATGQYKDVSYSVGGSYSVSKADEGEAGMLSHSVAVGSTYSESTAATTDSQSKVGTSTSVSEFGDTYSTTTVKGLSKSTSVVGESISDSTVERNSTSTSTVNGDSTSTSTVTGNSTNTSTVTGNSTSTSTVTGNSTSTSTVTGNSTNTTIMPGTSTNTNTLGVSNSISSMTASTSISTMGTSTSDTKIGASASNTMIGASASNTMIGANGSNTITGANISNTLTGVNVSVSTTASSNSIDMTGLAITLRVQGAFANFESGPGIDLRNKPTVDARIKNLEADVATLKAKIPGLDVTV